MKITSHSHEMEVIVAFGDFRGFTAFHEAVTHKETELIPFMDQYDDLVAAAVAANPIINFTDVSDGFMFVVDVGAGNYCLRAVKLLKTLIKLLKQIQRLIKYKAYPYPDGFRIRIASGHIIRKVKRDGKIIERGKHMNLTHKMLHIEPSIGIICHESFKQLITKKCARANGFFFNPIPLQKTLPEGVMAKDAAALWEIHARTKG